MDPPRRPRRGAEKRRTREFGPELFGKAFLANLEKFVSPLSVSAFWFVCGFVCKTHSSVENIDNTTEPRCHSRQKNEQRRAKKLWTEDLLAATSVSALGLNRSIRSKWAPRSKSASRQHRWRTRQPQLHLQAITKDALLLQAPARPRQRQAQTRRHPPRARPQTVLRKATTALHLQPPRHRPPPHRQEQAAERPTRRMVARLRLRRLAALRPARAGTTPPHQRVAWPLRRRPPRQRERWQWRKREDGQWPTQ